MKKRLLAGLCLLSLVLSGCGGEKTAPKKTEKPPLPARTLLVVPYDRAGAQAFVTLRFSDNGVLTVTPYPRETVVYSENAGETTFYMLFADGDTAGFSRVLSAFSESGIPVDRILSVDVSDAGSPLYTTLSATGNNLLFTNPPDFVYTVGTVEQRGDSVAISASQLRRLLSKPPEEFDRPEDYVSLRGLAAIAVLSAGSTAFSEDGFFALIRAGSSSFSPADKAAFSPLFSPSPTIVFRPVSGEFVGVGSRKRFYLSS